MKVSAAAAFLMVLGALGLRADFGYEIRTEVAGGTLLEHGRQPVALRLIKGKRMATVTRQRDTVVNLENDTILEIDFASKTYRSVHFPAPPAVKAPEFHISSKTGSQKAIGILTAREHIFSITSPAPSLARIFLDSWTMTPPNFGEAQDFLLRLAAKLGYAYALGIGDIAAAKPELSPGFEKAAELLLEGDEMSVATVIRIGTAGSGDLAPADEPAQSGIIGEALGRVEKLARRKKNRQPEAEQDPALLADVRIALGEFAAGPAEEAKFNPPAGFKELKPAPVKPAK